jgi:hypothetical protein
MAWGGLSQPSNRRPTKSKFVVAPQENFSAAINFQKIFVIPKTNPTDADGAIG